MTIRRLTHLAVMTSVVAVLTAGVARAEPIGSLPFVNFGQTLADGSPTGDINTATMFDITDLVSNTAGTGDFTGMPPQFFGPVTLNLLSPTSLVISSPVFGTFQSTAILNEGANANGTAHSYVALGNYTPGTFVGPQPGGPFASELAFAFSQVTPGASSIGFVGTFTTPTTRTVPEPATSSLLGIGFAALAVVAYRRRKSIGVPDVAALA